MEKFIKLQEAIDILNKNIDPLGIEEIDLINGVKRTIASDMYSTMNNPPFDKSAMDGYAIYSKDTINKDVRLRLIDKVYAGNYCNKELSSGEAIKIMTGAPIPKGADCVIKQEDVVVSDNFIYINRVVDKYESICFEGEDIKKGNILVKKNKKLDYADIGILASSGINKIKVYKKPKIAFISTGDEILDIDESIKIGQIYNSNKYSILSRIEELGYDVIGIDHSNDDIKDIGERIRKFSKYADLIITTGGVSVGEKDLMIDVIDNINGEKLFWKITIKPGSAVLCSKLNNTIIISLSGNPTASLTTFELLVRTTLEKLSGQSKIEIKREKAVLLNDINKKSPQNRFIRGKLVYNDAKQCVEITQVKSGNGILSSTINSNCLIEIPKGNNGIKSGTLVDIIKF